MNQTINLRTAVQECFLFSLPLIAGQVGQMLFGVGDLFVAGRYNQETVAALAVANSGMAPFFVAGLGMALGISPFTSGLRAQNKDSPQILFHGLVLSGLCSILLALLVFTLSFHTEKLGLAEGLAPLVSSYVKITAVSLVFAVLYQVCKEYLQAYEQTFFANALIIFLNVVNVLLNIVFVFGHLGFPEMGISGTAWATLICRFLMMATLLTYTCLKHPQVTKGLTSFEFWSKNLFKDLFKMSAPIAGTIILEVSVFSIVTIMAGKISVIDSAAHGIALNFASLTFMVPLAIASTASVKVAYQHGLKNIIGIELYAKACLLISVFFMAITALSFMAIPEFLVSLATSQKDIILAAAKLLLFVGLFQIPDGLQVALSGSLRGLGKTTGPFLVYLISYWPIGLPLSYILGIKMAMGTKGLWLGLMAGVYLMAILLGTLFSKELQKLKQM